MNIEILRKEDFEKLNTLRIVIISTMYWLFNYLISNKYYFTYDINDNY